MSAGATPASFHWAVISETKAKVRACLNLGTWPNPQRQRTLSSTMLINDYTLPLQNINSLHSGHRAPFSTLQSGFKEKKKNNMSICEATASRPDQTYFPTTTLSRLPRPTPVISSTNEEGRPTQKWRQSACFGRGTTVQHKGSAAFPGYGHLWCWPQEAGPLSAQVLTFFCFSTGWGQLSTCPSTLRWTLAWPTWLFLNPAK